MANNSIGTTTVPKSQSVTPLAGGSFSPESSLTAASLNLIPRDSTYVHPSWLAKALAGDRQCRFSLHTQANYKIPKVDNGFDAAAYKLQHQKALSQYADELRSEGFKVYTEAQNSFWYTCRTGAVVSAQPDIVAVRGDLILVPEIKTGKELRAADTAQVKLYMALIPAVGLHNIQEVPTGQLVHHGEVFDIPSDQITPAFTQEVAEMVEWISASRTPAVVPSVHECRFCPLRNCCPSKLDNVQRGSGDWL